jgi:F like protein
MLSFRATSPQSFRPFHPKRFSEAENILLVQRIADRLIAKFTSQFLGGLDQIRTDILRQQLIEALLRTDILGALESVQFPNFAATLSPIVEGMLGEAMAKAGKALTVPSDLGVGLRFDLTNPRAVDFIRRRAAELVTRVTDDTRLVLRELIDRAFGEGIPPAKLARLIEQHIGLLPKHAVAAENFRIRLLADGKAQAQVDKLVERYTKKLLRYRATNIARTEIMTASNRGQDELWRQRAEKGLLDLSSAKRVWIASDPCPICTELDGQEAGFNETFPGGYDMPPIHPSCKCTLGLVT